MTRQLEKNLEENCDIEKENVMEVNLMDHHNIEAEQPLIEYSEDNNINIQPVNILVENKTKTAIKRENQKKKNSGQSYFTNSSKQIEARKCIPLKECRKKCSTRLYFNHQQRVFKQYWSFGNYKDRILFCSGLIEIKLAKRLTNEKDKTKNRYHTYYYHVFVDERKIELCQKCFRFTLGETDNFIRSVAKKKLTSNDSENFSDGRGKAGPQSRKISEDRIQEVKSHILSFPHYVSHYSRRHTNQKYFAQNLNQIILFDEYKKKSTNPVSKTKFKLIFRSK